MCVIAAIALLVSPLVTLGIPSRFAIKLAPMVATARESATFPSSVAGPVSPAICGTPGALDASFGTGGRVSHGLLDMQGNLTSAVAHAAVLQPDGKLIVGGTAGELDFAVARYNPDGSLDSTFGTGGIVTNNIAIFSAIQALVLQPDGKIVAAGYAFTDNPGYHFALARYNANGTLDTSFGTGGRVTTNFGGTNERAFTVELQSDRKIVATGNSGSNFALARYNADGLLDNTFGTGGKVVTPAFGTGAAYALAIQRDGKILTAGISSVAVAIRYNANGTLDGTFSGDGILPLPTTGARAAVIQPDDRILVAGDQNADFAVTRVNPDGTIDTSFGNNGVATAGLGPPSAYGKSMALLPDGRILVAGDRSGMGFPDYATARFNSNGTLDTTYGTGGKVITQVPESHDIGEATVVMPDGRILVAGYHQYPDTHSKFGIVRYIGNSCSAEITVSDGSTYRTDSESVGFGQGTVGDIQAPRTFTIRNDGTEALTLGTVSLDGANSSDFMVNTSGMASVLAVGESTTFSVRFTAGGPGPRAAALHIQNSDPDEASFDLHLTGRGLSGVIFTLTVNSPKGSITSVPAGIDCPTDCSESFDEGLQAVLSLRATPRVGYRFTGWSGDASGNANPLTVTMTASKNITANYLPITLFDYDGDGRADLSVFRPSDSTWYIQTGTSYQTRHFGEPGDTVVPADYDGDFKTDIAVFRPADGRWFHIGSATQSYNVRVWGQSGDIPVPMVFGGQNGISVPAVYRPNTGRLYRIGDPGGVFAGGASVPARGDFDGDGLHDFVAYGPFSHAWRTIQASGGGTYPPTTWGADGDKLVPADYDGDGRTDIAVYRPSTGQWFIIGSTLGWIFQTWGVAGDIPVPADYDGDGRADVAVFRPSNGMWYLLNSAEGMYFRHFGQDGDIPIPGAYSY
jgi:uncharacterized delta-60 repeat protein/uncharacterized repeat protein (TIGR02543 family)